MNAAVAARGKVMGALPAAGEWRTRHALKAKWRRQVRERYYKEAV